MHERTNPGLPPERPPATNMPASLTPVDETAPARSGLDDPRALQILSTEHWSLLAGRSLAYNEAFTRAGMFLTALSASMVAIAFVAQADRAGSAFPTFTLILLGFDLFVGLTTYLRLVETTREDLALGPGHEPDPPRLPRDGARARAVLRVERSRRPCRHPDDLRGSVPRGHDGRTAGHVRDAPRVQHQHGHDRGRGVARRGLVRRRRRGPGRRHDGPRRRDRCHRLLRAARGPPSDRHRLDVHLLVADSHPFPERRLASRQSRAARVPRVRQAGQHASAHAPSTAVVSRRRSAPSGVAARPRSSAPSARLATTDDPTTTTDESGDGSDRQAGPSARRQHDQARRDRAPDRTADRARGRAPEGRQRPGRRQPRSLVSSIRRSNAGRRASPRRRGPRRRPPSPPPRTRPRRPRGRPTGDRDRQVRVTAQVPLKPARANEPARWRRAPPRSPRRAVRRVRPRCAASRARSSAAQPRRRRVARRRRPGASTRFSVRRSPTRPEPRRAGRRRRRRLVDGSVVPGPRRARAHDTRRVEVYAPAAARLSSRMPSAMSTSAPS